MVSERAVYAFVCGGLGLALVYMFQSENGTVNKQRDFLKSMNKGSERGLHLSSNALVETGPGDKHVVKPVKST